MQGRWACWQWCVASLVRAGEDGRVLRCPRDIKLENTLLDGAQPQPNVKICDFGYSKNEFVDSRPKTVSGTPDYIAPEVRPRPDQALFPCILPTHASWAQGIANQSLLVSRSSGAAL